MGRKRIYRPTLRRIYILLLGLVGLGLDSIWGGGNRGGTLGDAADRQKAYMKPCEQGRLQHDLRAAHLFIL